MLRVRASDSGGQPVGMEQRDRALRRHARGAERHHAHAELGDRASGWPRRSRAARWAPAGRATRRHVACGAKRRPLLGTMLTVAVDASGERGLLGVVAHPQLREQRLHLCLLHHHAEGARTTASAASRSAATRPAAKWCWSDLPAAVGAATTTAGRCTLAPTASCMSAVGDNGVATNAPNLNPRSARCCDSTTTAASPATIRSAPRQATWRAPSGRAACATRSPFAVQPGTGRIHINDVGEGTWEEINVAAQAAPTTDGPLPKAPPAHERHHRSAVHLQPQRGLAAGLRPRRLLRRLLRHRRRLLSQRGPFPAPWRGGYFFTDLRDALRRLHRSEQRQRRLFVRHRAGLAGRACWSPTTAHCWCCTASRASRASRLPVTR